MDGFSAAQGRPVLSALIEGIHANAARLSQIDGATGDGDHGINMDKGFLRTGDLLGEGPFDLATGLSTLGKVLVTEIGGAMGPLYGSFYLDMASAIDGAPTIDAGVFDRMLAAGVLAISDLGEARPGDKTLLDALLPAQAAFRESVGKGDSFEAALGRMAEAAEAGAESTKDMVARVGRASRLGERSRGFLDAGSVSCAIQLRAMADSMAALLAEGSAAQPAAQGEPHQEGDAMPKPIAIGSDEAGFDLKAVIIEQLEAMGLEVRDFGCHSRDPVDYPDVAFTLARAVARGEHERGILICGTGIGMAIAANKVPGIRAAQVHDPYSAERARKSNDAQIMTMGARVIGPELARSLVDTWLASEFGGGNSARKVQKIMAGEGQAS